MVKAEVVLVNRYETYSSCRGCKGKVVKLNEVLGECTKCCAMVKLSKGAVNMAANMVLESDDGNEYKVTAFSEVIDMIIDGVEDGEDVTEKLLMAPVMIYTITKKNIVAAVSK